MTVTNSGGAFSSHEIIEMVRHRVANLFENQKLCCSESILLVLNNGFNGTLSAEQAKQLGSGFCGGMGEAGCTCGALSGAIMGIGLLVGPHTKGGLSKKDLRQLARKMHDRFHARFSSTCCRVLIKPFDKDKRGRQQFCGDLTATTGAIVTELLLETAPHLADHVQVEYLRSRDSKLSRFFRIPG